MCSFCPISCLPYSIFCIHQKKLLSAIVISLHLKEKRLFDSFSAVSQISQDYPVCGDVYSTAGQD